MFFKVGLTLIFGSALARVLGGLWFNVAVRRAVKKVQQESNDEK